MKILLLEDNSLQRNSYKKLLESNGFEVVTAANSKEAFDAIHSHNDFDLLISDIDLSSSKEDRELNIDGIQVAKKITTKYIMPVIFFTNYDDPETQNNAKQAIVNVPMRFISKDILNHQQERLIILIQDIIDNFFSAIDSIRPEFVNRKIGIHPYGGQSFMFYSKDEIIYLEADGNGYCKVSIENQESITISGTLITVHRQICRHYPNFVKLGARYSVNLEKCKELKARRLTFSNDESIILSPAGVADLKKHKLFIRSR